MADDKIRKPPASMQALRILALPKLPRKLPSRNWIIFWTLSAVLMGAFIYDRREKRRATARWANAVAHIAREPISNPQAMPRRLTIFLSAPPGDGLRVSQDHYNEYVKPVLAASGLDWEFVQGRRQGDIRAAVAERVRKMRRRWEKEDDGAEVSNDKDKVLTDLEVMEKVRKQNNVPEYDGVRGDVVIGRHTWKEYVRGMHEGWLGPLSLPPMPEPSAGEAPSPGKKAAEAPKKARPPQPRAYHTPNDYGASSLSLLAPIEFAPCAPVPQRHLLGFFNFPTRLVWFLNRRALADDIGREVAAAVLCNYREFRELSGSVETRFEQQTELENEEDTWVKDVWKEAQEHKDEASASKAKTHNDRTWAEPLVMDQRIAMRMRRFEMLSEDEARSRSIDVSEEEIEGVVKGALRSLCRWGAAMFAKREPSRSKREWS